MKPTLAIVGRPNVGKSTLFNRLTRGRNAIVADIPGVTRDRHYGHACWNGKSFIVVDTGGFEPDVKQGLLYETAKQTMLAVDEADAVAFLVDGREGLTPQDEVVAEQLRRTGRSIWVVVNKTEGMNRDTVVADFHRLGLGEPVAISSGHGEGVSDLADLLMANFPRERDESSAEKHPKIAVVGRPNVGKSTLVNSMLGEDRVLVFDQPGTTRDSINIDFTRNKQHYTLIDTAGLRRRGRVNEVIEKFSVVRTLQAIEEANVTILVLDAQEGISDQDAHIGQFILEAGRALVIAVNKWDSIDAYHREQVKRAITRKLGFLDFAKIHYISAIDSTGVAGLFPSLDSSYTAAMVKMPTPKLTRVLLAAVIKQQPPRSGLVRPKLRYAHQGGTNPPLIIIHGNAVEHVTASYQRYLERSFCEAFKLHGTPLKVQFKRGRNPYLDKRR